MRRKAIILAAAVSAILASSTASSARAEEPIQEILSSWREWRLALDRFHVKEEPPRARFLIRPVMPVDRSYDHLVDLP